VEDDPSISELMRIVLIDAGFEPELAASGKRALERVRVAPPDMLIMDLHLDGNTSVVAIAHDIRAAAGRPLPILIASASHRTDLCEAVGAYAFVAKPFDVDELVDAVKRGLSIAAAEVDDTNAFISGLTSAAA
jgi:DNA-binding response OmpR family regulator